MANNKFLAQIDKAKQDCFVAGCEITAQQMFDLMCLVLHDPEVMGKGHTIGASRLKKFTMQCLNLNHNIMMLGYSIRNRTTTKKSLMQIYGKSSELSNLSGSAIPFADNGTI